MVKKILVMFITIALMTLYSCAGKTDDGSASGLTEESIAVTSKAKTEDIVSVISSEMTDTVPDGTQTEASSDETSNDTPTAPHQSLIGVWSTDESKTDQILIYEISPVAVKFNSGITGLFGFDATAMLLEDEFVFGDGISPGYSGPDGLKGKLILSENSITVVYDDFGSIEDAEYYPTGYTFTLKDENSDNLVEEYKASLGN